MTAVLGSTICVGCGHPMSEADSCTDDGYPFVIDGHVRWLSAIPYGDDREGWEKVPPERCHDCSVTVGSLHHWGCDMAQCPNCGDQLFGCGCDMRSESEVADAER